MTSNSSKQDGKQGGSMNIIGNQESLERCSHAAGLRRIGYSVSERVKKINQYSVLKERRQGQKWRADRLTC